MRVRDRVAIGWIDGGQVDGLFALSMVNLFTSRSSRISSVVRVGGSLLSRQRNEVVQSFLDDGAAEWLFFIDTDEQIDPEAFDKIIDAAHDKERPVVAGLYFGQWPGLAENGYPPVTPMIMRKNETGRYNPVWDFPDDAVIPVDAAGTGALLIHRSVLEKIRESSNASAMKDHEQGRWCWFRDMPVAGDWLGEDIFFCRRVRDMGIPIVAATGARLSHHKEYWLSDAQYVKPKEAIVAERVDEEVAADEAEIELRKIVRGGSKVDRAVDHRVSR